MVGDRLQFELAARWLERLTREPVSDETRAAFGRWLEQSSGNRTAYASLEHTWQLLQGSGHDPKILALRHETALRLTRRRSLAPRWQTRAAAAVAAAVIGVVLLMGHWSGIPGEAAREAVADHHYATAVGERLEVRLSDGSQVALNTNTALQPAFTSSERRVVLRQGQAFFEVAKDPKRPFIVEAQDHRFTAVGTAFDVRVEEGRLQVTMLEGTVRVAPAAPGEPALTALTAGEQLTVRQGRLERVRLSDPADVTGWREGKIVFEDAPLEDVVAEFNRYSTGAIVLADSELADLRISGSFATDRPAVFVEALASYFPIEMTETSEHTFLLRQRAATSAR